MSQPTTALIASVLLLDNPEEPDKAYFVPKPTINFSLEKV